MNNQLISLLKSRIEEASASGVTDAETLRNALKEELQYYVLDFVYHHPDYKSWVMYGGSALLICHGLDRMSVDLDFEVDEKVSEAFLQKLQEELAGHFERNYQVGPELLTMRANHGRGLTLRFLVGEAVGLGHASDQIYVRIDLNHFVPPKTVVTERHPINRSQLSFVITTYNMAALMASKIAAIFLRGERGVGAQVFQEKGRDIYDLLWYMGKKIVPDFDYLAAKQVEQAKDIRTLFTKLTIKMNQVSHENLSQDLSPLFFDRRYIANWLAHWHESYLRMAEAYKIRTVADLAALRIFEDFSTDVFSFVYEYRALEGGHIRIVYKLSDYWIDFAEGSLPITADASLDALISFDANGWSSRSRPEGLLRKYATLFRDKTEAYLKKTGRIVVGDGMVTKLIRMTANNLNNREQIVLNKSALISCDLDDLLK